MKSTSTTLILLLALAALVPAVGCSRAKDARAAALPATVADAFAAGGAAQPTPPPSRAGTGAVASASNLVPLANATGPTTAAGKEASDTPGKADAGKGVYLRVCFACHQPTGLGLPGVFPPLAGSSIVTEADPGKIIRIVLHGLIGPIEVKGVTYNGMMPPHAPQLKDQEIADVLTYVRNEWSNKAAPVTVEAVAKIRATVNRPTPWTWAELNK